MIQLNFTPPNTQEWNTWVQDCTDATVLLVESYNNGNPIDIKASLYKQQKHVFHEEPFFGKCSYCECGNSQSSPVYVEHYRPKGSVRHLNSSIVQIPGDNGAQKPHHGYYWLAYNWANLLPTCWKCNSWHQDSSGQMVGKGDRFPVSNDHSYQIGDEVHEDTLIINPITENPDTFLGMDSLGRIFEKPNSNKGRVTIEIFGLNERESILNARKKEYQYVKLRMKYYLAMDDDDPKKELELNALTGIRNGCEAYTMAARKAIADEILRAQQRMRDVM